ncbi:hypothetical protein WG66_010197 [Moniliophthora roreri]|uniref:Uncharacterized protein n=1 Tax=Moniliophthora roreri TaxID=221103 RepID=A0A0W0EXJ6_MONRR|nr:hypothetical protein WG66_010197 [Moniliophthora roreri]
MHTLRLFNSLLIVLLLRSAHGLLAVGFIDDTLGDSATGVIPVYTGSAWAKPPCVTCLLQPNASRAHNRTWHDNTRNPFDPVRSIQFNFTGVALSVFCIVPNKPVPIATTKISLDFTVDGGIAGAFTHSPDGSSDFTYDFPVFAKDGLSNGEHSVEITMGKGSNILFDYVQYTFDDGQPDPRPGQTVIGTGSTTTTPTAAATSTSPTPSTIIETAPEETSSSSSPGNQSESTLIDSSDLSSFTMVAATSTFSSISPSSTTSSVPSIPASNSVPETSTTSTNVTEANSPKNRLPILLGVAFGTLPFILVAIICLLCFRRRRHRRASDMSVDFFPMRVSTTTIGTSLARSPVDVMETFPSNPSPILYSIEKRRDLPRNDHSDSAGSFQPQGASSLEFQEDETVPPPYHSLFEQRNRQEAP